MGKLSQGLLSQGKLSGVSGGGGIDFLNPSSRHKITALTGATTNRVTVNGEGWVVGIIPNLSAFDFVSVSADASQLIGTSSTVGERYQAGASDLLNYRFESSFSMGDSANTCVVAYLLGTDYATATPKIYNPKTSGSTSLRLSVTGSGLITSMGYFVGGNFLKLVIDGITIMDAGFSGVIPLNFRYNTSFQIYTGTAGYEFCNYIPD